MTETLDPVQALSSRLAALVRDAGRSVVRVDGRRRGPASGVVFAGDGLVVTAHHTLEREEEVALGLPSGETVAAEVVGRDPTTDLAVLRTAAAGLEPAAWAEADALEPGALVVGISRPGRGARASLGVLARAAGAWRTPAGGRVDRYLETTLDLHPGVSGSLAVSPDGCAVGVLTAGVVRGAALAIPAATLRRVVEALRAHGHVRRGYLGIATIPVALPAALEALAATSTALLVTAVEPDSPAACAGLLLGDAIVALGGAPVTEPGELLPLVEEERIGTPLAVRVLRAGEPRDVTLEVGTRPRTGSAR